MAEPLSDERLAFARDLADPYFSLSVTEQAKAALRDLLAEVDRLRAALAQAERARDEAWDGKWRTIPQDEDAARRALMSWTKAQLVERYINEWQKSIERQDFALSMLTAQRDAAQAALHIERRKAAEDVAREQELTARARAALARVAEEVDGYLDSLDDHITVEDFGKALDGIRAVAAGEQTEGGDRG